MAFTYEPTYITWENFKEQTTVSALADITQPAFNLLIRRAELLIDSFVGIQKKFDFEQTRQFPRDQDVDTSGNPVVPDQIVMATILILEALYKYGETKDPQSNLFTSERIGDYSYQKGKMTVDSFGVEMIPGEAHQYLMGFRRRTVQISPPEATSEGYLNSRQKFVNENY